VSLVDYRRKRRFDRTREPEPGKPLPRGQRAIFVVQLHHASRRHYDFRLQVGDALKSWAVPKGPSYDPEVKRMAVEVEDHPVDYAGFEGEIPKGEYGGGHVARFDHGVWSTEGDPEAQLAKGHLRFELFGDKLKGGWHLVRSGKPARQPQWLLFKDKDAYAGKLEADDLLGDVTAPPAEDARRGGAAKKGRKKLASVPTRSARRKDWAKRASALQGARRAAAPDGPFEPQLARLGEAPPQGEQWLHEIKWDGYRILATATDGKARLWSRNALEWTGKLPEIVAAIEALGLDSAALDGELIAGSGTRDDFNLLQATLSGERQGRLSYALFDLLHVNGVDITGAALIERKALLQEILAKAPTHLAYSSHIEGDGEAAHELAARQHFEGIISKRGDRPYRAGRGDDWRKTKQLASDEFAVVGYTAPKGSRTGFGSLLLARPDPSHGWLYAGRVGSGFNDELMRQVSARLARGGSRTPSVHVGTTDTDLRTATWFPPRFVVEVFYRGIGRQQLLRQPSLKAVRLDKDVDDLADSDRMPAAARTEGSPMKKTTKKAIAAKATTKKAAAKKPATEKTAAPAASSRAVGKKAATKKGATKKGSTATKTSRPRTGSAADLPTLSSPTKVLFPDIRATKQEVWDYYLAIADHLLPEIVGRPLSVIRCPEGTSRSCFFQKHLTAGLERVDTVRLKEESGTHAQYLVVRDLAGLMELVQFNALEFHPWGSHAEDPDRADRVVFDLDPGPDVPFAEVKRAAVDIRKLLAQLELESFLRVSGGKGLHVVVPLRPGCDWDLTRRFAHGFADALARSEPDRFLATATKRLRNRRIFVDYLRNGRGATAVASYSLRAREGAPVAMPLSWNDLGKLTRANAFTMKEVPARLRRRRKDPWEGIGKVRQNLARWADQEE
jgi:bifunctional non-homologous end joining protein LigD